MGVGLAGIGAGVIAWGGTCVWRNVCCVEGSVAAVFCVGFCGCRYACFAGVGFGVGLCIAVCGWPNVCRDGVRVGVVLGSCDRTPASFGGITCNGVGVGVGDFCDLGRLYFIWPNANGVTRKTMIVARMIRVIIGRRLCGLIVNPKRFSVSAANCKAKILRPRVWCAFSRPKATLPARSRQNRARLCSSS